MIPHPFSWLISCFVTSQSMLLLVEAAIEKLRHEQDSKESGLSVNVKRI